MIRKQEGPKPKGWVSIEIDGHLLTGEKVGGQWTWDCDTIGRFDGEPEAVIGRFLKYAERNPK